MGIGKACDRLSVALPGETDVAGRPLGAEAQATPNTAGKMTQSLANLAGFFMDGTSV